MTTEIVIDPSALGAFFVVSREVEITPAPEPLAGEERQPDTVLVLSEYRKPLVPGHWEGDTWYDTDLTDEPDEAKAYAAGAWTPEVVAEFKDWSKPEPVVVTAQEVKAEANRRILAILPEYQQRNSLALFAETAQTYGVDPAGWPSELQAVNDVMMAKWAAIKAIRARSDEIEVMDPIPADYTDDAYWVQE